VLQLFRKTKKLQRQQFYPRVQNVTDIKFTKEETKLLNLAFEYGSEKQLAAYFTNLVTETQNAIKLLDAKLHNAYRTVATKQPKQILNTNNSYNILHKRQLYVIKQLKQVLETLSRLPSRKTVLILGFIHFDCLF
jgi:hypothetical protein